ncbi:hypothetical protein ACO2WH_25455, partial [Escherichia coli]|uniref:hypothetical protein n=1 Tax=Escherichia coli TaxID=562 RepID=UPI003C04ECF0
MTSAQGTTVGRIVGVYPVRRLTASKVAPLLGQQPVPVCCSRWTADAAGRVLHPHATMHPSKAAIDVDQFRITQHEWEQAFLT